MKAFGFEFRQAARRVFTWKQTGAVLIPAIGLALATIMFAVGWSYSSLSLPYKDADRLVIVGYVPMRAGGGASPAPGVSSEPVPVLPGDIQPFFDWKERKDVFTDVAATRNHYPSASSEIMIVRTPTGNLQLGLLDATVNFFDVLGISFPGIQAWKASLGSQAPLSVTLPNKTGAEVFAHPEIGEIFQTHDGKNIAVNGILPANFVPPAGGIGENGVVPFEPKRGDAGIIRLQNGAIATMSFHVIGRLAPGMTPQLAEQILVSVSGGEIQVALTGGGKYRLAVRPVVDIIAKPSQPFVWGAWALGALTLILCTANLAGLLLTRCVFHLREYAMRSALGARFSNLLRMMLMELLLLSALAALVAAYIARITMPAIAERLPVKSAAFGQPVFGREAIVFLIIATLSVAAASGLFSIIALARNYYKGFSPGIFAVFHSHRMPRIFLTAGQTAIATVLLCLSWMTVRGYLDIYFRDPGVNTSVRIVGVRVSPGLTRSDFAIDTLEALRGGDPNMQIGVIQGEVLTNRTSMPSGYKLPDGTWINTGFARTSPGLFRILKAEILAGRDFTEQDRDDVVLINESLARQMVGQVREAVGKQLDNTKQTVIGVVRDFPAASWDGEILPMVFGRMSSGGSVNFVIHPDAMARAGNVERTILRFDPDAVITRNAKWSDLLGATVRGRTFATFSVTLFAVAAIAIVVIGIVSTVTFIVARRKRDIAIQIAIGAPSIRVCWFVVKDMAIAGAAGALIGGMASWWAGKAVAHYIYNGEKYQNLTGLAIAVGIMLVIIAAAALLPALRALRIEPGRILNME
ncbi:MAG: ABC transporter permease [Acidobacteriota bacterium]|jgi:ABC-type antimicrobial peptide transport system permease subunit|nr:ABC transporter permease [Acidobacteriota bacterium]